MMNAQKSIKIGSQVYIGLSVISLGYVAILSLINPQMTMDLVATNLPNTDAVSSIRGIYGGVGFVITLQIIYLLFKDYTKGLLFLSLFWGAYAISRCITIYSEGPLGDFGNFWIRIEFIGSVIAIGLFVWTKKYKRNEF